MCYVRIGNHVRPIASLFVMLLFLLVGNADTVYSAKQSLNAIALEGS